MLTRSKEWFMSRILDVPHTSRQTDVLASPALYVIAWWRGDDYCDVGIYADFGDTERAGTFHVRTPEGVQRVVLRDREPMVIRTGTTAVAWFGSAHAMITRVAREVMRETGRPIFGEFPMTIMIHPDFVKGYACDVARRYRHAGPSVEWSYYNLPDPPGLDARAIAAPIPGEVLRIVPSDRVPEYDAPTVTEMARVTRDALIAGHRILRGEP